MEVDEKELDLGSNDYAIVIRDKGGVEIFVPTKAQNSEDPIPKHLLSFVAVIHLLEKGDKNLMKILNKEVKSIIKRTEEKED